jgi:uncharacterized protein (TIGR03083 family)
MRLDDVEIVDVRPLITAQRADFITLLRSLESSEWALPTVCAGWSVKHVAAHVLSDDLGWLSMTRDQDVTGLLAGQADDRAFVNALNEKNQAWANVIHELSPRLLCDLLAWVGREMDAHYATLDLAGRGFVRWAGGEVPQWFDVAQDLSEHWLHEQQIREAVDRPTPDDPYLRAVLRTLVWALPHHYRTVSAPEGVTLSIEMTGAAGGHWTLTRGAAGWQLNERQATSRDARVVVTADAAWRLFAGALAGAGAIHVDGDARLTAPFSSARGYLV